MTAAEEALLNAILGESNVGHHNLRHGDAIAAVLQERTSPEAREKFARLHRAATAASAELHAYCHSLPSPLVSTWFRELDKEVQEPPK